MAGFFYTCATAQQIDSLLLQYGSLYPAEKIYLHTDRQTYFAGETVWYKAYITAGSLPSDISTNLYADLLDDKGRLLQHKVMPIIGSTADGFFKLPDTLQATAFVLRAYTLWQLNFDTAFIYHKKIRTAGLQTQPSLQSPEPEVNLHFFAEGGNMVSGLYNYVAFKATLSNGLPYELKAVVKNSKGELTDSIETIHNGMGLLKFTPETGEIYTAEWIDNRGQNRKTVLPAAQAEGIVLHAEQVKDELYYLLNSPAISGNLEELTVVASLNQKTVYNATLKPRQMPVSQKIFTRDFESGILQLTVFNKNRQPLAERIVFINNNNYQVAATINLQETGTAKRAKNTIEIETKDTASSNFSVAVYDADLDEQPAAANMYSSLLLQADIKGYIHNAAWYFDNNNAAAGKYLDLVMQTNGWRRYNWEAVLAQTSPLHNYETESYLNIYGKISGGTKQEPKAGETITIVLQTADSAKQWYMPISAKDGTFKQPGLVFYDTAMVFYKPGNSKDKTLGIGMANNYNGLTNIKPGRLPLRLQQIAEEASGAVTGSYTRSFLTELINKNPGFEQTAKLMNEVMVKSGGWRNWKNDPILKMDEKYAGMFRGVGANAWAFDIAHDSMALAKQDIYNYLFGKIPGLTVSYSGFNKRLTHSRWGDPVIFLNESEIDNDWLNTINILDIAYVKFIQRISWRQLMPSALMIYLKKENDNDAYRILPGNLSKLKVAGYAPVKEFYSPDYSIPDAKHSSADLRSTLYWQPYVLTNKENSKTSISFYNNDISKKLKIVLEGINEEGKLIHIEKIIE